MSGRPEEKVLIQDLLGVNAVELGTFYTRDAAFQRIFRKEPIAGRAWELPGRRSNNLQALAGRRHVQFVCSGVQGTAAFKVGGVFLP
ncbi:hypothetical protein BaRGS_00039612 [Batillaria attramentaria]|uniref:Uncharacterized protein n=1 Tax=Batillaria attramentaria TaxID=370345 RepID=A0ABD0J3K6_9CAEN